MEQEKAMVRTETITIDNNNSFLYTSLKRMLDLICSLIGLIVLAPIFLVVIVFYLFGENKGPILFSQKRLGKNGQTFQIYKFRTMVVNAEEKLKANRSLYNKYVANGYKLEPEEDPRITKFGSFLRRASIDEIPQLINVLKGEMSLVGPRPIVEQELREYRNRKEEFLSVKPGVTGYWQVSGRSDVNYPERVDLELYYVQNKSFLFDLKILFKTFFTVILQKGAY